MDNKVNKTYESSPDDLHTLETKTPVRETNIQQNPPQDENHAKDCKHQLENCTEWIISIAPDASISISEADLPANSKNSYLYAEKIKSNVIDLNFLKQHPHRKKPATKQGSKRNKSLWRRILIMSRMFLRKLR